MVSAFFLSDTYLKIKIMESDLRDSSVLQKTETQVLVGLCVKFLVAFLVLMMIDTLVDLGMGLIDLLIELGHVVIEMLEVLVEVVLEKYFHANKKQSEIVFLNILVLVALGVIYHFIRFLPCMMRKFEKHVLRVSHAYVASKLAHWKSYSFAMKLKLVAVYILGFYCLSMLIL